MKKKADPIRTVADQVRHVALQGGRGDDREADEADDDNPRRAPSNSAQRRHQPTQRGHVYISRGSSPASERASGHDGQSDGRFLTASKAKLATCSPGTRPGI